MGTLIRQELYKMTHKNGNWLAIAFMVVLQVGFLMIRLAYPDFMNKEALILGDYVGGLMVIMIMIASTASIVASEYQYGTMKQLLYRQYYRSQVFMSKVFALLIELVFLQAIASAVTFIMTFLAFPSFNWAAAATGYNKGLSYFQYYWISNGAWLLTALMIFSLVLLLSTLFKSNAAAIATGFVSFFLVQIAEQLMVLVIHKWEWFKWTPFTMLMSSAQVDNPALKTLTKLATPTMLWLTAGYTVIFTIIAYLSFRRRSI